MAQTGEPHPVSAPHPQELHRGLRLYYCVTHDIVVRHVALLAIDAIRSEGNIAPVFNAERAAHVCKGRWECWCALSCSFGAVAAQTKLEDNVNQAVTILERFREIPEQAIPEAVIHDAKGLAILTVLKAGFLFSGQGGLGLVVARTRTGWVHGEHGRGGRGAGWSAPSAIGTGGAGFGFQVGAEVTEYVMVLNTDEALKAF
jgi:hypothetical protein